MTINPDTLPSDRTNQILENENLRELLTFNLEDGRIWLDDRRVTLQDVSVLGALRTRIIELAGMESARVLLQRIGYDTGVRDAKLIVEKWTADSVEAHTSLYGFQGICKVEEVSSVRDPIDHKHIRGEWIYHNCAEADAHIEEFGIGTETVCWMETGYASGYMTTTQGIPLWIEEAACRAMGHPACRIVGRRLEPGTPELAEFNRLFLSKERLPKSPPSKMYSFPPTSSAVTHSSNASEPAVIGTSAAFKSAMQLLESVAATRATVLITGESGVGKELFTRTLHRISDRSDKPFIAINCAAIPDTLIESELFGADKGAYTGAVAARAGRFERAEGGTLFLDEITSLNTVSQAKLLRVLQEGEYERVGGSKTLKTDVRVVAATNVSLRAAVDAGEFREDLFFRLNVFPIHLPPLRERRDDISALLTYFRNRFNARHKREVPGFTHAAVQMLLNYRFPGNIRELENLVERAVILARNAPIDVAHLLASGEVLESSLWVLTRSGKFTRRGTQPSDHAAEDVDKTADAVSKTLLHAIGKDRAVHWPDLERSLFRVVARHAIDQAEGNISEAARIMGMERHQFAYRLKQKKIGS